MFRIEYDPSQTGLRAVFRHWQEITIQTLLENPGGLTSRQTWVKVNEKLGNDAVSRASIVVFLEALYKAGILTGEDRTGKGGHHLLYRLEMGEAGLRRFIVEKVLDSLLGSFPDEVSRAIKGT